MLMPVIVQYQTFLDIIDFTLSSYLSTRIPILSIYLKIVILLKAYDTICANPVAVKADSSRSIRAVIMGQNARNFTYKMLISAVFWNANAGSYPSSS